MADRMVSAAENSHKQAKIYALHDPVTGRPRYVGQTVRHLCNRLAGHCHVRDGSPKSEWVRSLKESGLRPSIALLEAVGIDQAVDAESLWIDRLRESGEDLLNEYSPDLSAPRPESSRRKISAFRKSHVGWSHSEETKAKIGRSGESNSQAKLTADDVRAIRGQVASGESQRSAARRFGVCAQTVCDIISGKKWAHVE